jgi:anti-sigma regulatory factor (Ser/Thr protein kinase)
MEIILTNSIWIGNIDPFLRNIKTNNSDILHIKSHKKWVSVHPVVLAMVAAIGLKMKREKKEIKFYKLTATSKHYFKRMGLFDLLEFDSEMEINEHESAGRFITLQKIKNSDELDRFITEMVPLLHSEPKRVEPIRYIIYELVRNVIEHADSPDGALICAQYYKKSNTIRIGVVDTGIGVRQSISQSYSPKDDLDALFLSLTPGITGTTTKIGGTESNAGAGLFFTKSLAKTSRDFFMIYSGHAMYKLLKAPKQEKIKLIAKPYEDHSSYNLDYPYWQGTVVGIDLCLNEHEDFNQLLDMINNFYSNSRKQFNKEKYKKPQFL